MLTQDKKTDTLRFEAGDFDLDAVFNCGQCFRWERLPDGAYAGVAFAKKIIISREGGALTLRGATPDEFEPVWRGWFDLDRD